MIRWIAKPSAGRPPRWLGVLAVVALTVAAIAGCGGGSGSSSTTSGSTESTAGSAKPETPPPSSADRSVQNYGSSAEGEEKEAVVAAADSFHDALADGDYDGVCVAITASNREQLEKFAKLKNESSGDCPAQLEKLLTLGTAEAKDAAAATISKVRLGNGFAFALFTPSGGKPSYLVLKEEDGTWKATSLAPGTPLHP